MFIFMGEAERKRHQVYLGRNSARWYGSKSAPVVSPPLSLSFAHAQHRCRHHDHRHRSKALNLNSLWVEIDAMREHSGG